MKDETEEGVDQEKNRKNVTESSQVMENVIRSMERFHSNKQVFDNGVIFLTHVFVEGLSLLCCPHDALINVSERPQNAEQAKDRVLKGQGMDSIQRLLILRRESQEDVSELLKLLLVLFLESHETDQGLSFRFVSIWFCVLIV